MAPNVKDNSKSSSSEEKKEIKIEWDDKDTEALIDFYNDKVFEI